MKDLFLGFCKLFLFTKQTIYIDGSSWWLSYGWVLGISHMNTEKKILNWMSVRQVVVLGLSFKCLTHGISLYVYRVLWETKTTAVRYTRNNFKFLISCHDNCATVQLFEIQLQETETKYNLSNVHYLCIEPNSHFCLHLLIHLSTCFYSHVYSPPI